jgi:tetratricopeptide (TPR) repeat protein
VTFIGLRDFYQYTGQIVKMNEHERRLAVLGKDVYYGLALSYAMLAMWDPAQYWIERGIQDFPEHPYVLSLSALIPAWEGRYPEALRAFSQSIASSGVDTKELSWYPLFYGWNLAMAGESQLAVLELEPDFAGGTVIPDDWEIDGRQALALALIGIGQEDRARALLQTIEQTAAEPQGEGRDRNPLAYWLARNAALLGDKDLALERLRKAIDTGWRGYYTESHDPRWSTLRDNPRFQEMMAEVKADMDRQRLEVEKLDAEEDLPALVDEARARRAAAAP